MSLHTITQGWSESEILGVAAMVSMALSVPVIWACERVIARLREIRTQRRTLARLRPRATTELELTHRRSR